MWRDLKDSLRHLPKELITTSETDQRIDLHHSGGSIEIHSTHYPDNLRGAGLDFVILDEAAFMEKGVWSQIVRPMLATSRGSAMFLSTPYGRNWFWEMVRIGYDAEEPEWRAFHFKTADNPNIAPEEIESIKRETPERIFQEEYMAQFHSDAGRVFRGLSAVATAPSNAQPIAGHRYIAGVDWGLDNDYTAIAIIDATTNHMVALDRFREIGWELQRGRIQALHDKWQLTTIWAESNSIGTVNIEALQASGLPVRAFYTSAKSKRPLIEGLSLAIERQQVALLNDPVLLHELASYSMERLLSGGWRYSAPAGGHDDTVIATALAWHGILYGNTIRVDFA